MTKSTKTNHYTYIIRHINGRYYVGRRSTKKDPLLDTYMGSGKSVKGIKDKSTLTKTIIAYYDTFDELKQAEFELIEKYFDDVYCMNVLYSSGGAASGDKNHMYGRRGELHPMYGRTGESHHQFGKTGELSHNFGRIHTEKSKQNMSDSKSGGKHSMCGKTGKLHPRFGSIHTEETKQKISDAHSGEKAYNATITKEIVKLILIRIAEGIKDRPIYEEFDTTKSVVQGIRSGRNWKHITI